MAEERSLCRVDWKLGQALMPDHFLWQEDTLRREVEMRAEHQSLPTWGLVELGWDEELLRKSGRLSIHRLELVFETGSLVDIPGNASPVYLDLPKPALEPIDVYVHLASKPEMVKGGWSDREGSLIELRMQKLELTTEPFRTPLPGFRLLRLKPFFESPDDGPKKKPSGWILDEAFAPPCVDWLAFRPFGESRFKYFHRALERWLKTLRRCAVENALGVHKRVEASLYLRRAFGLAWDLRQRAPARMVQLGEGVVANAVQGAPDAASRAKSERSDSGATGIRTHPFDLFSRFVGLYLDIYAFRSGPLQVLRGEEPRYHRYDHEHLGRCFAEVEMAIESELNRPGAGAPGWFFVSDPTDSARMICKFPETVDAHTKLYFLVEFVGDQSGGGSERNDLDARLEGMRLAAPLRLEVVHRRSLPGIPLERVRMLPFPHDFDANTVQFYELKHGAEWAAARESGAVAFYSKGIKYQRAFLYSPDMRVIERVDNLSDE